MKEAQFYHKLKNKIVQCELCPHYCTLKGNELGKCGVRKNIKGKLYSMSYEQPVSIALDPIEKKPLYHFMPKTKTFSIGMAGCNLRCLNCQNWQLSQKSAEELKVKVVKAEEIIKMTIKSRCPSISYTYSEPLVSWEYVYEIAKLAKKAKIKNTIVSNGFINPEPLKQLCKYLDGANIDLKSIRDDFYKKICGGRVAPVLEALKILKKEKIWIEITNLLIPGLNDSEEDIKNIVSWIENNLGKNVPVHFTAFYPCYQLSDLPATSIETLRKAKKIARKLSYVYTGNIQEGNDTFCPKCKKLLIKRSLFSVIENNLKGERCSYCHSKIPGFWGD